jgi:formylglycine-generating enzyme required for sulfatase activity
MKAVQVIRSVVVALTPVAACAQSTQHAPGAVFRDCQQCPEMVVIPAGTFTMGSPPAEKAWAAIHGTTAKSVADEAPQHQVSVRSFALGKFDVTRAEYAAFVRETAYGPGDGCGRDSFKWGKQAGVSWEHPGFDQTDRDPVVCVSWEDARAYVAWLNRMVGHAGSGAVAGPYRLATEAEWEFAARGGTTSPFWWGDGDSAAATHAWYRANAGGRTHPVGLMPPNGFGLYDMAGDVWQWTEDCYAESYANAPADGRAATPDTACLRVDRGGSWLFPAVLLRSATRERNPADFRDEIMGFRVARTLP